MTRGARVWASLVLGDVETAHRYATRMPSDMPSDRFHRAAATELVRFVEGAEPAFEELRARAAELDEDGRTGAAIDIGLLEALVAAANGGDWRTPILAVRDRLEGAFDLVIVRWLLPVAALIAVGALVMTLVAAAFSAIVS
jgi:hypothetical protein